MNRAAIYAAIDAERARQDVRWGGAEHDRLHNSLEWLAILSRMLGKAAGLALSLTLAIYTQDTRRAWRHRLVQIAAVCVAAIEADDSAENGQ